MQRVIQFFLPACLAVLLLSACNKGVIYQKYITIPHSLWDMNKPVSFDVNIEDTVNYYNVFVNVRNADNYEYGNLYLFIDITSPAHITERDTLECILANPVTGRWLGNGLGDIWDNKILFKRNVRFPRKGEYNVKYTQAMRLIKLPMIMDVGLCIQKVPVYSKSSK